MVFLQVEFEGCVGVDGGALVPHHLRKSRASSSLPVKILRSGGGHSLLLAGAAFPMRRGFVGATANRERKRLGKQGCQLKLSKRDLGSRARQPQSK